MTPSHTDIVNILRKLGLDPDPWQLEVLEGNRARILLNCSRQAGKSTVVALLALLQAVIERRSVILLLSRSQRQSAELFRMVVDFFLRLRAPNLLRKTAHELELTTGSRIVSLPCNADTIRGYSGVTMLVIDEAARVPDHLYRTVRPMLAASGGRLICLSTPNGKHGFFYDAWAKGGSDWTRIEVPADRIPRIAAAFLEEERRNLGDSWYRQEYECSFEALEGLVYPDFARCILPSPLAGEGPGPGVGRAGRRQPPEDCGAPVGRSGGRQPPEHCGALKGRRVGGIDFGFRNPFAAVWGTLDRDGILWLTGEYYQRLQPLSYHLPHLPRDATWYADPAGANEIAELRCAGFTVRRGLNALRPGIMAVTARINNGTLKMSAGACPNLLHEAGLYRWSNAAGDSETPLDEHNHALAALRYLVSRLDERQTGRSQRSSSSATEQEKQPPRPERRWLSVRNEALWRQL